MKKIFFFYLLLLVSTPSVFCEEKRPNIIVIMADDMGYSDLGCYGSEINTPNLDKLAAKGMKFTQFYNNARCCPTRASLLTGIYPHQAGMGEMVDKGPVKSRSPETPYQGWLSHQSVTIAEVLKTAGYTTYMSGKWHVGEERQDWPLQRGFDKYFGLVNGTSSYFEQLPPHQIVEGNDPYKIPENFYMTDAISEKAVGFINESKGAKNPFFMYVAYTAPHFPLHAPAEEIAKYRGKYMIGWDKLREQRHAKQLKLGLLPKGFPLSEREAAVVPWENATDKDEWDLKMATYAAMITCMDAGIGKIVAQLKANGQLENTMVVFLADNGGCAEVIGENQLKGYVGDDKYTATLATPTGQKGSFQVYGKPWAIASNTPFRFYKQFTHEGGISTPFIVHFPKYIKKASQTNQVGHIMDIMPTCLELANARYPTTFKDNKIKPLEGLSLMPIIEGKTRKEHEYLAWEHFDCRALRQGNMKLVWAKTLKKWELYDIVNDRCELNDLAAKSPQKLKEMIALYDKWAAKAGVEERTAKKAGE